MTPNPRTTHGRACSPLRAADLRSATVPGRRNSQLRCPHLDPPFGLYWLLMFGIWSLPLRVHPWLTSLRSLRPFAAIFPTSPRFPAPTLQRSNAPTLPPSNAPTLPRSRRPSAALCFLLFAFCFLLVSPAADLDHCAI